MGFKGWSNIIFAEIKKMGPMKKMKKCQIDKD